MRKKWLLVPAIIVLMILGNVGYQHFRFESADRGFRSITGQDWPTNVVAIAHTSAVNDNLFHTTHFWHLQGSRESLRALAPAFGLERSDEDARYQLPEAQMLIPLGEKPQMLEGYEGSLDGGRDRWLLILAPGDRAIFRY